MRLIGTTFETEAVTFVVIKYKKEIPHGRNKSKIKENGNAEIRVAFIVEIPSQQIVLATLYVHVFVGKIPYAKPYHEKKKKKKNA